MAFTEQGKGVRDLGKWVRHKGWGSRDWSLGFSVQALGRV